MSLRRERESLSEEEVFDLLSSSRRRDVLRRLGRKGEPVEVQRLADEIAAQENGKTVDQLTSQERKRLYVSLYQTHIPAMADTGVIEFDPENGGIVPKEGVGQLQSYLAPREVQPAPSWNGAGGEPDVDSPTMAAACSGAATQPMSNTPRIGSHTMVPAKAVALP